MLYGVCALFPCTWPVSVNLMWMTTSEDSWGGLEWWCKWDLYVECCACLFESLVDNVAQCFIWHVNEGSTLIKKIDLKWVFAHLKLVDPFVSLVKYHHKTNCIRIFRNLGYCWPRFPSEPRVGDWVLWRIKMEGVEPLTSAGGSAIFVASLDWLDWKMVMAFLKSPEHKALHR